MKLKDYKIEELYVFQKQFKSQQMSNGIRLIDIDVINAKLKLIDIELNNRLEQIDFNS